MDRPVGRMDTLPDWDRVVRGRHVGPEREIRSEPETRELRPEEETEASFEESRRHLIWVMNRGAFVVD